MLIEILFCVCLKVKSSSDTSCKKQILKDEIGFKIYKLKKLTTKDKVTVSCSNCSFFEYVASHGSYLSAFFFQKKEMR